MIWSAGIWTGMMGDFDDIITNLMKSKILSTCHWIESITFAWGELYWLQLCQFIMRNCSFLWHLSLFIEFHRKDWRKVYYQKVGMMKWRKWKRDRVKLLRLDLPVGFPRTLDLNSINVAMILTYFKSFRRGMVMDLVAAFVIVAATSLEISLMIEWWKW